MRKLTTLMVKALSVVLVSSMGVAWAASAPTDASLQADINAAMAQTSYDDQVLALDSILENVADAGISDVQSSTAQIFYNALTTLFNNRVVKYRALLTSKTLSIQSFSILLDNAVDSPLLATADQRKSVGAYADTLALEEYIFELPNLPDYPTALSTLRQILYNATSKTFIPEVQTIFFNNLTNVFNRRINSTGNGLVEPTLIASLQARLNDAKTTPLLAAANQQQVTMYLAILALEQAITAQLATADLLTRWNNLAGIATSPGATTITSATQNIYFNAIQTTFNAVLATPIPSLEASSDLLAGSIKALVTIQPSSLLNATQQGAARNFIAQLQNAVFSLLQQRYNTGRTSRDVPTLTALQALLQSWLTRNVLTPPQNAQIQAWLNALAGSMVIANIATQIPTLGNQPLGTVIKTLGDWLDALLKAGVPLDSNTQDQVFALLTQLYNAQGNINDIPTLQSLVDLFTRWAKSNLLKPAQTNTIITIWIPTILKHIAQLQFSAQVPTTPSGNLPTIPAPGTVVLSAQDQNNIFAALKYRYDNRIVAIRPLLDLQALLTAWLNSALLTNDQNNTISSVWLAQIAKELDALRKLSSLGFDVNNPGTGTTTGTSGGTSGAPGGATSGTTGSTPGSTTGGTITTKLPQVTVDNFPQPGSVSFLPKSIIDQLIAQLLALINSRNPNNQDALNKLRLLLLGMLGNGTLTPGQQNDLKNAQSSIDNDLALLQLRAQLANAANLSGQALLDWLNNILGTLQGKTLDAATQNSIFALLQKAYNGRIKTIDALSKLNDLLSRWANSNLLSPAQTATIQQQWIPTIMLELSTLQLLQAIANALAQSDYATKLASLKAIITTAQGLAQIDPSVQTAYYNALITVYNQRQPLAATLAQLIDLLNSALTSNLLNDQQKAALQPIVASLGIIARINALMAMTDYAQCIGGHGQLLKDVQGQSFAATVQNLYAQAIMQVFNQRMGQPLDQLRGLSTILNTAQTTPLLAPAQQAFVKAMIATLTVEIMILDALSRSDYGAQLDGLLDMIFTFQNTRVTDARTQNLFFEALKTVFSRRVSQFAPSITDDSNLDKLHLLLLNSEESTLLNAQQQLVAGAYGDIVTIEQMILDVRNQAAYADRLAGMNRVLNSSIGRAFDPASNDLAFTVITALYNDRVNNPAQLNALKQALTTAATSPLLNFDQQQQVRQWLAGMGITINPSPIDQNLKNVLNLPNYQDQLNALLQLGTKTPTTNITPQAQAAFNAALQELLGGVRQQPQNLQLLINILIQLKNSPMLSPSDKANIDVTLGGLQPAQTGAAPSSPTAPAAQPTPGPKQPSKPGKPAAGTGKTQPQTGGSGTSGSTVPSSTSPTTMPAVGGGGVAGTQPGTTDSQIAPTGTSGTTGTVPDSGTSGAPSATAAAQAAQTIKTLTDKIKSGGTLTADEQAQLQQALQTHQQGVAAGTVDQNTAAIIKQALQDPAVINKLPPTLQAAATNTANTVHGSGTSGAPSAAAATQAAQTIKTLTDKIKSGGTLTADEQAQLQQALQTHQQAVAAGTADPATTTIIKQALQDPAVISKLPPTLQAAATNAANTVHGSGTSGAPSATAAAQAAQTIKTLTDKIKSGGTLTADEQAQLQQALQTHQQGVAAGTVDQNTAAVIKKALQDPAVISKLPPTLQAAATNTANTVHGSGASGAPSAAAAAQAAQTIKTLTDKIKGGGTLTADEQAQLQQALQTHQQAVAAGTVDQNTAAVIKKALQDPAVISKLPPTLQAAATNAANTVHGSGASGAPSAGTAVKTVTLADIQAASQAGSLQDKIKAAEALMAKVKAGAQLSQAEQTALASLVQEIASASTGADAGTLKRVHDLLAATSSTLPAATNLGGIATLATTVKTALATASVPNQTNVALALASNSPQSQLAALTALLAGAQGQSVDPATQAMAAQLIQQLLANSDKLTPAERQQLVDALDKAKTSPLLSSTAQQAIDGQIKTLTAKGGVIAPTSTSAGPAAGGKQATAPAAGSGAGKVAAGAGAGQPVQVVKAGRADARVIRVGGPSAPRLTRAKTISATDAVKQEFSQQITRVKTAGDVNAQITALQKMVDWSAFKTIEPSMQDQVKAVIDSIGAAVTQRSPSSMAALQTVLKNMQKTSLLSDAQKNALSKTLASTPSPAPAKTATAPVAQPAPSTAAGATPPAGTSAPGSAPAASAPIATPAPTSTASTTAQAK